MEDFQWVYIRAACCPVEVLKKLRLGSQADVEAMNRITEQLHLPAGTSFEIQEYGDNFTVTRCAAPGQPSRSVEFSASGPTSIVAKDGKREILRAMLILNKEGRCVLLVETQELDLWQVRQRALEGLLF